MNPVERVEWLKERKKGLGGTDIASICGVGYSNPLAVYEDKTNPDVLEEKEVPNLLLMGLALEKLNIEIYCKKSGLTYGEDVSKPKFITWNPRISHAYASLDFQRYDGRPIDTKYTIRFTDAKWGEEYTDQVQPGYITQVHWQMDAAEAEDADIPVLSGSGEHRIYRVVKNPSLMQMLIEVGGEFWDKFIQTQTPPPENWMHPAAAEMNEKLIAIAKERQVVLGMEAEVAAAELVQLKELADETEFEIEKRKLALHNAMDAFGVPRAGKAIAGGVRLSRWIVAEQYVEPKPYTKKAYAVIRATAITPKKGKLI